MSLYNTNANHLDDCLQTRPLACLNNDSLENHYQIKRVLGEGSYGKVYEATKISNGQKVAIKKVPKSEVSSLVEVSIFKFYFIFI